MVGLDTGYFMGMMLGDKGIIGHWEDLKEKETAPCVSVLTLGEILHLTIRIGKPQQGRKMVEGIEKACTVLDVNKEVGRKGRRSQGRARHPLYRFHHHRFLPRERMQRDPHQRQKTLRSGEGQEHKGRCLGVGRTA